MARRGKTRPPGSGQPKIIMPEPDFRNSNAQNYRNGVLIPQFGEATVKAAEVSVVLDIMIMTGIVKPAELIDLIEQKCRRIDDSRRRAANLDEDR
jgi:hypothetical protein